MHADGSYGSSSDPRVLFGLGDAADITKVQAHWVSGLVEEWTGLPLRKYTTLREGSGFTDCADGAMIRLRGEIVAMFFAFLGAGVVLDAAASAAQNAPSHMAEKQVNPLDVPKPDLTGVDAQVQEQIHAAQSKMAAILAQSDASRARRAEAFGNLGQIYQAYRSTALHWAATQTPRGSTLNHSANFTMQATCGRSLTPVRERRSITNMA